MLTDSPLGLTKLSDPGYAIDGTLHSLDFRTMTLDP